MKVIISISLIGLLLFSSCASMLGGSSQLVKIKTNVAEPEVKVNGKQVDFSEEIEIPRGTNTLIKLSKEGYESTTYVPRSRTNPKSHLVNIFGVASLVGGVALMSSSAFGLGVTLMTTAFFQPMIGYGVDLKSGAIHKFKNEHTINLIKLPNQRDPEKSIPFACTGVNFKIKADEQIGSYNNRKGKMISTLTWNSALNVRDDEMTVQVNNELNNLGYNIPGLRNVNKQLIKEQRLSKYLEVEVVEVELNQTSISLTQQTLDCRLKVNWNLVNKVSGDVIYSLTTEETARTQSTGQRSAVVLKSLTHGLWKMLDSEEFDEFVSKGSSEEQAPEVTSFEEGISVNFLEDKKLSLEQTIQAVVTIRTEFGHGSGFIISKEGHILTNSHVVNGANKITILLENGFEFEASLLRESVDNDLALLKIPGSGFKTTCLNIASKNERGSEVTVIGTPANESLSNSVSKGIISGFRMTEGKPMIQTDAQVSKGNSGGPLVDSDNQVIGIVSSKIVREDVEGISFAIPIKEALEALNIGK